MKPPHDLIAVSSELGQHEPACRVDRSMANDHHRQTSVGAVVQPRQNHRLSQNPYEKLQRRPLTLAARLGAVVLRRAPDPIPDHCHGPRALSRKPPDGAGPAEAPARKCVQEDTANDRRQDAPGLVEMVAAMEHTVCYPAPPAKYPLHLG